MKKEAKYKIFPKWGRIEVTDDNEKWKEDNKWLFETPKCENCKFCREYNSFKIF